METDYSSLDDESLVPRIWKGSPGPFEVLVRRHARRFYRVAYRFVLAKDEAEDIVQTAFLKLWENPRIWDPAKKTKFITWFHRVVINLCLDENKRRKPVPLADRADIFDGRPDPEASTILRQRKAILAGLMRELPDRQRTALVLCFYEGMSNKEAAEIMELDVKAVQSLIMRAKFGLREKLQPKKINA